MKITELFKPKNAKSRDLEDYIVGETPYVSNSNINNGIVRYVDADIENEIIRDVPCIAVNGFGFATVQLDPFIGSGSGGVHIIALAPIKPMNVIELSFYASQINLASWRFSYGRRAILKRLLQVQLIPFNLSGMEVKKFEEMLLENTNDSIRKVLDYKR